MRTFRFILEYDGTDFAGWQSQQGSLRTVQDCLADALERITGSKVRVTGGVSLFAWATIIVRLACRALRRSWM